MLIERIAKISLPLVLSLVIFSCNSTNIVNPNINISSSKVTYSNGLANIDLGHKNGANLKFGIDKLNFKIKGLAPIIEQGMPNSLAGNSPKGLMNVKSYKVWLIKNSSPNYPAGADPIGDSVAGSFEINAKLLNNDPVSGISFNNVASSNEDYYFMAIQAFDGELDIDGHVTGKSLIKQNNGSSVGWKGASAYPENRIAVSNSVKVDDDNQVSSLTSLNVVPMLEDGFGATVNSQIKLSPNMPLKQVNKCGGLTPESYVQTVSSDIESAIAVELDPIDGSLYILSDVDDTSVIKKISKDGTSSDVVSDDSIYSFTFDPAGNLYYTKNLSVDNYVVMKMARGSTSSVLYAGSGSTSGPAQDPRRSTFEYLSRNSIDFDSLGNLYIYVEGAGNILGASKTHSFIAKVSSGGNNISLFTETYPNTSTFGTNSGDIKISKSGYLYFGDFDEGDVHRYSLWDMTGETIFDNANTTYVSGLEIDNDDALYFSFANDGDNASLYKLSYGDIFANKQTILTAGISVVNNYVPASQAPLTGTSTMHFDPAGNLYYSESESDNINVIYNDCAYNEDESLFIPPV